MADFTSSSFLKGGKYNLLKQVWALMTLQEVSYEGIIVNFCILFLCEIKLLNPSIGTLVDPVLNYKIILNSS